MEEMIDKLIEMLQQTNVDISDEFIEELYEKGIVKSINEDEYEVAPEFFEKIKLMRNRKQIIFTATMEKNPIIEMIFSNPLAVLSIEEIKELLDNEKMVKNMDIYSIENLIKATGEIERYLIPEKIKSLGLYEKSLGSYDYHNVVVNLIEATGNIESYLNPETIKSFTLSGMDVVRLIQKTGNIEKYLTAETIKRFRLNSICVRELIELTGNIEKYLTIEMRAKFGLDRLDAVNIIKRTGNIEKYLTAETIKRFGLNTSDVINLILQTENKSKYLTKEIVFNVGLKGEDISLILLGRYENGFSQLINEELDKGIYDYNKIVRLGEIINDFQESNSERISRIAIELALQIYALDDEEQENAIKSIKNIYLTTNLPIFAQNFLVFKQLHPNFMEENNDIMYADISKCYIPSLSRVTSFERNHIIFSDLLGIAIESNSRNLRDYLYIIEQGDKLFNLLKEGKLEIDDRLSEESRQILEKYSNILNSLYNQTSKGKRLGKKRINSGNLVQDLQELDSLFLEDTNIQRSLPDRIVRMFGYWAGIRDFEQAKKLVEEKAKEADKRNRSFAEKGELTVQKGDFVKGIEDTEYFPSMLQNGVVAKDYLGQNSTSDYTPLDMDVELIKEEGKIHTATGYINANSSGRKLGSIIIVIKNDGNYVKTREGTKVDEEAVKTVIQDRSKKEYFDNNGTGGINAYGIRTGIGSTNISYIIANRYVDKLGLEIAINGFYIPVVDKDGKLLFTPEMYDEFRSKMQGMSYYGVPEFNLDESAKNEGTKKIVELIKQNKQEIEQKRQKIFQTLRDAIEECGLTMSDKRRLDLIEGIVEVIDTGSTGRGTNEPGDGDFDFMIRIDSKLLRNPIQIKEAIKKVFTTISKPKEEVVTAKGDFRYKGVSIQGLGDKVDLDLTFTRRTDEIEYTTEECIIDRLDTIKRNNPEDYKYVVANILLAKKVLKTEGTYKKKSAPSPEDGKKDIRGGLGAVGIENWILQNGGSFEKAARSFLEVARTCENLEEFQQRYAIWDFGENYMTGEYYPHDNFVYNMNKDGYEKMKEALERYIRAIETEQSNERSLGDIVREDSTVLEDTTYMKAVEELCTTAIAREEKNGQSR